MKTTLRSRSLQTILCSAAVACLFTLPAFSGSALAQDKAEAIEAVLADPGLDKAAFEAEEAKAADQEEEQLVPVPEVAIGPDLITVTSYPFSSAAGVPLEDMSSGTTQLVAAGLDDTASAVTNLGFDFWYDGVRMTQFSVNANGNCRLGPTVIATTFTNNLASLTDAPKICAYWDDLWVGTNGKVHSKVVGSAPNRKLVVEWQNMTIPRQAAAAPGAGTFQMWLFESSGVIEFVYGNGIIVNSANSGYSIGLQSGVATNFASVTNATATVSYAAANNAQTDAITAGTAYIFTPNIPAAPTGFSATSVTAVGMTLNWTDNATDEVGYAIYQSIDGVNYTFATQTAANATSFAVADLNPSTTYFFNIYAVTEGGLSPMLAGSQATNALGNLTSVQSGNWSDSATWGGSVPSPSDNATIAAGHTVTIDSSTAFSVTVQGSGVLQFEDTTARTLTVGSSVTIDSGGTFQSASTGTQTGHILSMGGNLTNNGTLDFSTNGDTAGAGITFTGATSNTFGGSGATTDIRTLTINKGTSNANVLELNPTNFTVRGVNTDVAGYLTLTNGTFKISGTFTMANRTFTTATYIIPATGGIWLNNPNYTVAATASAATTSNNGLFRITTGVYNIGIGAGDQMRGGVGAVFRIEGGTINVSGAFDPQSAVTYNQSGGTLNCGLVGNTVSNFGTFELFSTSAAGSFTMSGGMINLHNPSTGTTKVDYRNNVPTAATNISGGSVVIGATAGGIYNVVGQMPSTTIAAGRTMRVNGAAVFMRGTSVVNDGAIESLGTSPRYDFGSLTGAMTYSGTGTFGTVLAPFAGVGISANSLFQTTLNAPIICNRVNLFQGGFTNSNQITLGNAGASTTVVQIGSTGLTTPGGSFDVSPVHNQGSGGQILLYAFETAPRTTGVEVNPTRILTSINLIDNINGVTIAGGDLSLTATAAAIVLTNGRLITGSNTLILTSGTATVTRTAGYVDGNFRKTYAANASKTFEVGTANGYSPVVVNATAGTYPTTVTAKATQMVQPNIPNPTMALQRYWTLTGTGLTADLTFNYLDPADIPGTANENNFIIFKYDGTLTMPGGLVNPAANTATIMGVSSFSDWTLAENPATPLTANSAVSRLTHGAAFTFDIDLPLTGNPGIECRNPGGNYTVIVTFSNDVVSGNASVTTGTGSVSGSPTFSANTMTINLTGVTDVQQIAVTATNVTDVFAQVLPSTAIPMKVLIGDTNDNSTVNAGDVIQTRSRSGGPVDGTTFRSDVNADGNINAGDTLPVRSRSGNSLP